MKILLIRHASYHEVPPERAATPIPNDDVEGFDALLDDLHSQGRDLRSDDVVALIGHEPRLSQLAIQLASRRGRPLSRGEVIALSAPSVAHFRIGRGKLEFRFPDRDDQEEGLAGQIGSKMTVSALLAGFTFTALLQVTQLGSSPLVGAAALALVAAFALFIASTYMYDRLAMPSGFWVDQDRAGRRDADAAAPSGGASPQARAYDGATKSAARQAGQDLPELDGADHCPSQVGAPSSACEIPRRVRCTRTRRPTRVARSCSAAGWRRRACVRRTFIRRSVRGRRAPFPPFGCRRAQRETADVRRGVADAVLGAGLKRTATSDPI